jgi:hypothetical protein
VKLVSGELSFWSLDIVNMRPPIKVVELKLKMILLRPYPSEGVILVNEKKTSGP